MRIFNDGLLLNLQPGAVTYRRRHDCDPGQESGYEARACVFGGWNATRPVALERLVEHLWYQTTRYCGSELAGATQKTLALLGQLGWTDAGERIRALFESARDVDPELVRRRAELAWRRPQQRPGPSPAASEPPPATVTDFYDNPRASARWARMSEWGHQRFLAQAMERALAARHGAEPRDWIMAGPAEDPMEDPDPPA